MRKALLFLGILNDSDIGWLISSGAKREVAAGSVLIEEGRHVDAVYIVLEGLFAVTVEAVGSRPVAELRSGEIVGEMSFVDSHPPSATVKALDASTVLCVPRDRLVGKLESDPAFCSRFYRALAAFLASRLRVTTATLGYNSSQDLEQGTIYQDEIDPESLSNLTLAAARFEWIQRTLASRLEQGGIA